jgi:hypothetical protein
MADYSLKCCPASAEPPEPTCNDFLHLERLGLGTPPVPITAPPPPSIPQDVIWGYQKIKGSSITFNAVQNRVEVREPGTYRVSLDMTVQGQSATDTLIATAWMTRDPWPPLVFPEPIVIALRWFFDSALGTAESLSAEKIISVPTADLLTPFTLYLKVNVSDAPPADTAPTYSQANWIVEKICDETTARTIPSYGGGG